MSSAAEDAFLACLKDRNVVLFLGDGVKLVGHLRDFDDDTLVIEHGNLRQLIYKGAVQSLQSASAERRHRAGRSEKRHEGPKHGD